MPYQYDSQSIKIYSLSAHLIKKFDLKIIECGGGGHCLFYSVASFEPIHEEKTIQKKDYKSLRIVAAQHFRKIKQNRDEYPHAVFMSEDVFDDEQIHKIEYTNEWGDNPEIQALSYELKRPIIVFIGTQGASHHNFIRINPSESTGPPILLYNIPNTHFQAIHYKDNTPEQLIELETKIFEEIADLEKQGREEKKNPGSISANSASDGDNVSPATTPLLADVLALSSDKSISPPLQDPAPAVLDSQNNKETNKFTNYFFLLGVFCAVVALVSLVLLFTPPALFTSLGLLILTKITSSTIGTISLLLISLSGISLSSFFITLGVYIGITKTNLTTTLSEGYSHGLDSLTLSAGTKGSSSVVDKQDDPKNDSAEPRARPTPRIR